MRLALASLVLAGGGAGIADAHIALTYPPARSAEMKAGPCGAAGSTRGSTVTTFAPGQTITVVWDETIDHPGHYRIAFDDDGNDVFVNPHDPNDNFPFTLVEPIADISGVHHYEQQVTLPNIECTNCTLQLMQIMTTAIPYSSFYYQCADITLVPGGDTDTDPPPHSGGCATSSPSLVAALAALGLAFVRRKR
jgi:MYXO-CTERM domain-containing protein